MTHTANTALPHRFVRSEQGEMPVALAAVLAVAGNILAIVIIASGALLVAAAAVLVFGEALLKLT
ncbi:hypothetical protein [Microbacterium sp. P05]|uniref:hypothetical protein n=1 Tax=Microbacterium sp. P05 TaxID=3366948 RepID=UPI0037475F66